MFRTAARSWALLLLPLALACVIMPANAEKNLVRPPGTTRYVPMVKRLNTLLAFDHAQGAKRMQLSSLGNSVKGRSLWMVTVRDPDVSPEATRRLLYVCRQHGHEPASTEAALDFVTQLVKADPNSPLAECLKHVTVMVVPMANPDGSEAFLRHNAHDVDLNRDWQKRTQPETKALYRAVMRLKPDLMTDQHELYPDDTRGDFTETAGPLSGANPSVIEACESTQQVVEVAMRAEGTPTTSHWIDDNHPARLAHRYGCVIAGVPTILFETNRLSGHGRTVADRAAAHLHFMTIVLRDLAGERDELLAEGGVVPAVTPAVTPPVMASPATPPAATSPSAEDGNSDEKTGP